MPSNNKLEISIQTFEAADRDVKLRILFDILTKQHSNMCKMCEEFKTNKKKVTAIGAVFGFLGGLMAVIGRSLFGGP